MAKEMGDFEEISGKSGEQQRGQFVISRQTKVTSHRALVQNFQCGPFAAEWICHKSPLQVLCQFWLLVNLLIKAPIIRAAGSA